MDVDYVFVSDAQTVFDVVRGRLRVEDCESRPAAFHALLVAVLVLHDPIEYCDDEGWLNETPRKTVIKALNIGHWRVDLIVQELTAKGLMEHDGLKRRIVATLQVKTLLAHIEAYYGRFEDLPPEQKRMISRLTDECCMLLGGDASAIAALAYGLLRRAGAPLP